MDERWDDRPYTDMYTDRIRTVYALSRVTGLWMKGTQRGCFFNLRENFCEAKLQVLNAKLLQMSSNLESLTGDPYDDPYTVRI